MVCQLEGGGIGVAAQQQGNQLILQLISLVLISGSQLSQALGMCLAFGSGGTGTINDPAPGIGLALQGFAGVGFIAQQGFKRGASLLNFGGIIREQALSLLPDLGFEAGCLFGEAVEGFGHRVSSDGLRSAAVRASCPSSSSYQRGSSGSGQSSSSGVSMKPMPSLVVMVGVVVVW